jgi:hypothetical protein
MMRARAVLEAVPGMVISQHSGEGKANQYYLRGFNLDHGTDYIPGALDRVISAGLAVEPEPGKPLFGSLRVRHFGPRPLIEDATVKSQSTTLWNGELGYRVSSKARLVLELFNILNADVLDIDYFYASRLQGEPAVGVEDVHSHPALPRSARFGLQLSF